MKEEDQYKLVCKKEFCEIKAILNDLRNRLFVDNGAECIQSKINRHDRWIRNVMIVLGGVWAVIIGIIIKWLS